MVEMITLIGEQPPQGVVLQGNASGPAIWSVLSSVIFEILGQRGFSVHFCSAISKTLFLIVGYIPMWIMIAICFSLVRTLWRF